MAAAAFVLGRRSSDCLADVIGETVGVLEWMYVYVCVSVCVHSASSRTKNYLQAK